jgi:hypothetical protein
MFGELRCLNCGRHLADIVVAASGRTRIEHPAGQETRPILLAADREGLRCGRCGGRAMMERPIGIDTPRTARSQAA